MPKAFISLTVAFASLLTSTIAVHVDKLALSAGEVLLPPSTESATPWVKVEGYGGCFDFKLAEGGESVAYVEPEEDSRSDLRCTRAVSIAARTWEYRKRNARLIATHVQSGTELSCMVYVDKPDSIQIRHHVTNLEVGVSTRLWAEALSKDRSPFDTLDGYRFNWRIEGLKGAAEQVPLALSSVMASRAQMDLEAKNEMSSTIVVKATAAGTVDIKCDLDTPGLAHLSSSTRLQAQRSFGIEPGPPPLRIMPGSSLQLTTRGTPDGPLEWFSSDANVAHVELQSGLVTAQCPGAADVDMQMAESPEHGSLATTKVEVANPSQLKMHLEGRREGELDFTQANQKEWRLKHLEVYDILIEPLTSQGLSIMVMGTDSVEWSFGDAIRKKSGAGVSLKVIANAERGEAFDEMQARVTSRPPEGCQVRPATVKSKRTVRICPPLRLSMQRANGTGVGSERTTIHLPLVSGQTAQSVQLTTTGGCSDDGVEFEAHEKQIAQASKADGYLTPISAGRTRIDARAATMSPKSMIDSLDVKVSEPSRIVSLSERSMDARPGSTINIDAALYGALDRNDPLTEYSICGNDMQTAASWSVGDSNGIKIQPKEATGRACVSAQVTVPKRSESAQAVQTVKLKVGKVDEFTWHIGLLLPMFVIPYSASKSTTLPSACDSHNQVSIAVGSIYTFTLQGGPINSPNELLPVDVSIQTSDDAVLLMRKHADEAGETVHIAKCINEGMVNVRASKSRRGSRASGDQAVAELQIDCSKPSGIESDDKRVVMRAGEEREVEVFAVNANGDRMCNASDSVQIRWSSDPHELLQESGAEGKRAQRWEWGTRTVFAPQETDARLPMKGASINANGMSMGVEVYSPPKLEPPEAQKLARVHDSELYVKINGGSGEFVIDIANRMDAKGNKKQRQKPFDAKIENADSRLVKVMPLHSGRATLKAYDTLINVTASKEIDIDELAMLDINLSNRFALVGEHVTAKHGALADDRSLLNIPRGTKSFTPRLQTTAGLEQRESTSRDNETVMCKEPGLHQLRFHASPSGRGDVSSEWAQVHCFSPLKVRSVSPVSVAESSTITVEIEGSPKEALEHAILEASSDHIAQVGKRTIVNDNDEGDRNTASAHFVLHGKNEGTSELILRSEAVRSATITMSVQVRRLIDIEIIGADAMEEMTMSTPSIGGITNGDGNVNQRILPASLAAMCSHPHWWVGDNEQKRRVRVENKDTFTPKIIANETDLQSSEITLSVTLRCNNRMLTANKTVSITKAEEVRKGQVDPLVLLPSHLDNRPIALSTAVQTKPSMELLAAEGRAKFSKALEIEEEGRLMPGKAPGLACAVTNDLPPPRFHVCARTAYPREIETRTPKGEHKHMGTATAKENGNIQSVLLPQGTTIQRRWIIKDSASVPFSRDVEKEKVKLISNDTGVSTITHGLHSGYVALIGRRVGNAVLQIHIADSDGGANPLAVTAMHVSVTSQAGELEKGRQQHYQDEEMHATRPQARRTSVTAPNETHRDQSDIERVEMGTPSTGEQGIVTNVPPMTVSLPVAAMEKKGKRRAELPRNVKIVCETDQPMLATAKVDSRKARCVIRTKPPSAVGNGEGASRNNITVRARAVKEEGKGGFEPIAEGRRVLRYRGGIALTKMEDKKVEFEQGQKVKRIQVQGNIGQTEMAVEPKWCPFKAEWTEQEEGLIQISLHAHSQRRSEGCVLELKVKGSNAMRIGLKEKSSDEVTSLLSLVFVGVFILSIGVGLVVALRNVLIVAEELNSPPFPLRQLALYGAIASVSLALALLCMS